jgi:hypothetical protein
MTGTGHYASALNIADDRDARDQSFLTDELIASLRRAA